MLDSGTQKSQLSESSDEMDASLILEQQVNAKKVSQIITKARFRKKPSHDKPQKASVMRLREGIEVTKLSYSDPGQSKEITLRLSKDRTTLKYQKHESEWTFWDSIKGSSKISLDEVTDILFGAESSTFRYHWKRVASQEEAMRPAKRYIFDHYDARRHIKFDH